MANETAAQLPIAARRLDIEQGLASNQVLIVAGDTGSGKSTQLPQYCLGLGRGADARIAHTQPRRMAARALAARIAAERGEALGRTVGFRVRFADQVSDATRLVLMTDGLLLAELAADPLLRRYDTVIVDEAHERSLNVDLLMGVLKSLLPRRRDLKVIVTSATLDVERIAEFFGNAPIISVSGRSHPIEVRYREPPEPDGDADLPAAVLAAVREISAEPQRIGGGDVLVFLPGEREIRDVGEMLQRELAEQAEVLELYARLSWEQQSRIFEPGTRRRIVLATNVAETSITVPGIRAVIDSGLARVSRYSPRNRLQRLPIEAISRASADQRKGRCGRLGPGLCVRLYAQADFDARADFTEPEVLRTNLAALLLRLAADGLGEAEQFPFIDPPDARALGDGYRVLQELQALDADRRITRLGRDMARLPLDPRLARALLESRRFRCGAELLVIVAALSVADVRIARSGAPQETQEAAPAAAFEDVRSEFSALVRIWNAYRRARLGTRRELRLWCRERRFSLLRLCEWDDVYAQVAARAAELGIRPQAQAAGYTGVHRALLAGFCTMVGVRGEQGEYAGTRGARFHIFPGSPLARRRPRWVMAASIVETSRVYARRAAQVEPQWIESAAAHLVKREYLEPDWSEERGDVAARERVGFLGLILSANRVVNYGPIAPEESRHIFAREALVYHRLQRRPEWVQANDAAILAAQRVEDRLRTRGLVHGAESFVEFYDRRLPRQVSSAATLEHFSRHLDQAGRQALTLGDEDIYARRPDAAQLAQFPQRVPLDSATLAVEYRFAPGDPRDGACLRVPVVLLPGLSQGEVDAAVPGFAAPRIEALLRALPKEARRQLIPIPQTAAQYLSESGAAARTLRSWLKARHAVPEPLLRIDLAAVPAHLWVQIGVTDGDQLLAQARSLAELRVRFASAARAELDRRAHAVLPGTLAWRRFEWDELPATLCLSLEQGALTVFPTLAGRGEALEVHCEWTGAEAQREWRAAGARLARLTLAPLSRDLARIIGANAPLLLGAAPYMASAALAELLLQWTFQRACFSDEDAPRSREAFGQSVERGRAHLHAQLQTASEAMLGWFAEARLIRGLIDAAAPRHAADAEDTRLHLAGLFDAHALGAMPPQWLRQLPRYLKAERTRWQRVGARGTSSDSVLRELSAWRARLGELQRRLAAELRWQPALDELGYWIEEFRVSLYAQELKTLGPVSAARLDERAADIEAWIAR